MIKINVSNQKDVQSITISGHAKYAEYGSDIVCAGISMLAFTIANKILMIDKDFKVTIDENDISFINTMENDHINLLMETLELGFKMIEEEYPDNIKITRRNHG